MEEALPLLELVWLIYLDLCGCDGSIGFYIDNLLSIFWIRDQVAIQLIFESETK